MLQQYSQKHNFFLFGTKAHWGNSKNNNLKIILSFESPSLTYFAVFEGKIKLDKLKCLSIAVFFNFSTLFVCKRSRLQKWSIFVLLAVENIRLGWKCILGKSVNCHNIMHKSAERIFTYHKGWRMTCRKLLVVILRLLFAL